MAGHTPWREIKHKKEQDDRDVALVRRVLNPHTRPFWEGVGPKPEHGALDALDRVAARLAAVEAQDDALDRAYQSRDDWKAQAEDAEARVRELEAALFDAAIVIERMANGATRDQCSPEFERVHAEVVALAQTTEAGE